MFTFAFFSQPTGQMSSIDSDSDDEGEVPPLLGPGGAVAPSVPSVSKASSSSSNSNSSSSSSSSSSSAPRQKANSSVPTPPPPAPSTQPGAHLKPNNGLKKGFLGCGGGGERNTNKAAGSGTSVPMVQASLDAKQKSLELPEVQAKMEADRAEAAKMAANGPNGWMTPELMTKIAMSPILRKGFTDPRCQTAMGEMQANPAAAMKKYGDVPEMKEFLQAFAKVMADHFGKLAEKQEADKKIQEQQAAAALTPEQRKAQEVAEKAMADPEVRAIVAEPKIQQLIGRMQTGVSFEIEREMRNDPDLVRKLQKLSLAGLIGMEFRP